MERRLLLRHLRQQGCYLLREGNKHSIFVNPMTNRVPSVPRHRGINDFLVAKICRDLALIQLSKTKAYFCLYDKEFDNQAKTREDIQ